MIHLALSLAIAAPPIGRDLAGQPVVVDADTVLVAWSMADDAAVLADLARRADVVAVNVDPVAARSQLRPWMRAHGLDLRVVADPTHALVDRIGLDRAVAVQLDGDGQVAVAWTSLDDLSASVARR